MNWDVAVTAPDQITAEMWCDLLRSGGFSGRLHPGDTTGFLGVSSHSVRILVPEPELEKAREYLEETLSGGEEPED